MRKLLGHYKLQSSICIVLIVVAAAINIYAGYQLTSFYDILNSQNIQNAIKKGFFLALVWIVAVALQYLAEGYQAYLSKLFNIHLRDGIMEKISVCSNENFSRKEGGEYASWLVNDVQLIGKNAITPFFLIVKGASMTVFAVIALMKLHWILLICSIVSAIILSIIPNLFDKRLKSIVEKLSACNESFSQSAYDLLGGFEVFFVTDKIHKMTEKIRDTYVSSESEKYRFEIQSTIMKMLMDSIYRIFELSLDILAAILSFLGIVNYGVVFAMSNLTNRFLMGTDSLFTNMTLLRSAEGIFEKLDHWTFDDAESKNQQEAPSIECSIDVENLVIHYPGADVKVGEHYTFEIGKHYAIVGESGRGKTSLVRAVIGLNNQYDGRILFDGIERRSYHDKSVLKQFAYISQNTYLFTDTMRFNLTLGEKYSDEELYRMLEKVNLTEFISESEEGLDRMISNQQNNISGGQRQRIGIARALLQKKKIYIIDEGTSALDYKNAALIEDFFLSNPEYTILFITHHLDLSEKKFDKVYSIKS